MNEEVANRHRFLFNAGFAEIEKKIVVVNPVAEVDNRTSPLAGEDPYRVLPSSVSRLGVANRPPEAVSENLGKGFCYRLSEKTTVPEATGRTWVDFGPVFFTQHS